MITVPIKGPSGRYYWRATVRGVSVQAETLGMAWLGVLREITRRRNK